MTQEKNVFADYQLVSFASRLSNPEKDSSIQDIIHTRKNSFKQLKPKLDFLSFFRWRDRVVLFFR